MIYSVDPQIKNLHSGKSIKNRKSKKKGIQNP